MRKSFSKNLKKIFAVALAAAMAAPMALTVNVASTAAATVPSAIKTYDFNAGLEALIKEGAQVVNSETIYVVKAAEDLAEGEKLDANGLVYTGEGENAKYVTVDAIGSPKVIDDAERGKVLQFDTTVEQIDEYMKNASAKTDDMDEATAKELDFQMPIHDYFYVESGKGIGKALKTQNVSAELKVANPFAGLADELKEYEETADVDAKKYNSKYGPLWKKGVTVSYWIKVPVDEKGEYKNSSVLRWENNNEYYFQADDYAKYLPTKLFNQNYAKMTDEEKDAALKVNPSGVFQYGKDEKDTYKDPLGLMDFYYEYATGYWHQDENGYIVADMGEDNTGLVGPVYNKALIDEMQAAVKGKTKFTGSARFYFANPNFVDGFFPAADGSLTSTVNAAVIAVYDTYSTTPVVVNTDDASAAAVEPESSYIKLNNSSEKIDAQDSMIRYALEDGELQIDADDSIFWVPDNNLGINENVNVKASVGTKAGMQNADVFFMNSWQESAAQNEDKVGGTYASAVYAALSPVTERIKSDDPDVDDEINKNGNAGEWHHVAITLQNDWVEFYVDGECANVFDTYSSRGDKTLDNKKSFKRFNKGAGMRYGFGSEKDMGNIMYGNYVCRLLMDWLADENSELCFGGIGNYANEYAQAKTTSEVCLDNVKFYSTLLDEEQIKLVAQEKDVVEPSDNTTYELGDVNEDGKINLNDSKLILKAALGIKMSSKEKYNATLADLNKDSKVDLLDAKLSLKQALGIKK